MARVDGYRGERIGFQKDSCDQSISFTMKDWCTETQGEKKRSSSPLQKEQTEADVGMVTPVTSRHHKLRWRGGIRKALGGGTAS